MRFAKTKGLEGLVVGLVGRVGLGNIGNDDVEDARMHYESCTMNHHQYSGCSCRKRLMFSYSVIITGLLLLVIIAMQVFCFV